MFHLPFLVELSPFYLFQGALTIWMLIDASRRDINPYWFWIILVFQPIGAWAYFVLYKVKDFSTGSSWLTNLFTRRASLAELRYRVEQSPTTARHLELAERLVEAQEYEEAEAHLKSVLQHEPDHGTALFALAECYGHSNRPNEAVPLLLKLLSQRSNFRDYLAWRTLIETYQAAGNHPEAVAQARKLAQVVPSLENKCRLARSLDEAGDSVEARRVVEKGLEEHRFNPNPSRNDRRWVGRAKQLLEELG
jgi:hypothetical protein